VKNKFPRTNLQYRCHALTYMVEPKPAYLPHALFPSETLTKTMIDNFAS
jgi:hypothetical protein